MSTQRYLLIINVFSLGIHAALPTNDALCRQGKREINLSYQLPPYKEQGNSGACYSFAATSALEAALNRRDGKIHNLSETFNLATSALALSDRDLRYKVRTVKNTAGMGENAETFGAGGLDSQVLKTLIRNGTVVEANSHDLQDFTQFNAKMTQQALHKGEPYYLDGTPFRFKAGFLQPMSIGDLRSSLSAKRKQLLQQGHTLNLKGFAVQTVDLHFDHNRPMIAPKSPLQSLEGSLKQLWSPPSKADQLNPYRRFANSTPMRDAALDMFHAQELASLEPILSRFEAYTRNMPTPNRWHSGISDAGNDQFFANKINQDMLMRFASQNSRMLVGRTNQEKATDLVDRLTRARLYKTWLAQNHADLVNQRGYLGFNASEAQAVAQNFCDSASRTTQKKLLENLCRGIPTSISTNMNGVQISVSAPQSSKGWMWTRYSNSSVDQHALLAYGIQNERDPKTGKTTSYLLLRNTWKDSHMVRFPLSEACRIQSMSTVLTPEEQGRKRNPSPAPQSPQVNRH